MDNFYDGYEDLKDFTSSGLTAYRKHLLDKTQPQTNFITKHVMPHFGGRQLDVIEIGSGNGRLLVSLALNDILYWGYGLDVSQSRTEFAIDWAHREDLEDSIYFQKGNVLDRNDSIPVDLAVCITGCLQYFSRPQLKHVLSYMRKNSKYALFEIYNRPTNSRSWHELPEADRFAYLLDDYTDSNPSHHTKIFIKRDGTVDKREELLHYYSYDEFRNLLQLAGFTNFHWDVTDWNKDTANRVVLVS